MDQQLWESLLLLALRLVFLRSLGACHLETQMSPLLTSAPGRRRQVVRNAGTQEQTPTQTQTHNKFYSTTRGQK